VTTISPLYSSIDRSFLKLVKKDIVVYYDSKSYTFELFRSKDSLFLSNSIFDEIYPTSALTYTIFSLALLEIIDEYDIVHINDWHFGLLSHLIWLDKNKSQKVIFSIYNILYQGIYEFEDFKGIQNLDDGEFFGKLNILKLAVNSADIVTFTSKNYLEYIISTNLFSMGNFIREKLHKIEISNSLVDLKLFDPQNDEDIYHNYTARDFSNKKSKTDRS
jgi:starch synthase